MKVSREQAGILQHLDRESVRYVAVGDFAMLAIDPARMLQQAQLWIEPARQNLQRLNRAMKNMFGSRTTRQVDENFSPDRMKAGRQFSLGVGPFRVGIYFGIGGFKPADFPSVYARSQAETLTVPGQTGALPTLKRISNADLTHQINSEGQSHANWNLNSIQTADRQKDIEMLEGGLSRESHKGHFVLYGKTSDMRLTYLSGEPRVDANEKGDDDHKGHFVLYGQTSGRETFSIERNLDQIRQKLDAETVLSHYGFRPETEPKANEPWRIYERNIGDQTQRVVVGRSKETGQKQVYEVGNGNLRGDVLDLIAGLESGRERNGETLEQRVFGVTDQLLSNDRIQSNNQTLPEMKPVSSAYFFGTSGTVKEEEIIKQYGITPLQKTDALERLSFTKVTLYAPEFDGRIRNGTSGYSAPGDSGSGIAFPLNDRTGKVVDVATAGWQEPERYDRNQRSPDSADALWQSNRFYRTKTAVAVEGVAAIPAGTIGIINRIDAQNLTLHYQQDGQERRVRLPVQEGRQLLAEQPATRIVVGQSPVDLLAIKQLNPDGPDERRLYVATLDTPTPAQTGRIEELLWQNPQAQLVLATNQDAQSYRTAINALGIEHPAANSTTRIIPAITQLNGPHNQQITDRDAALIYYPVEPALRTSEDLLKRFSYHAYTKNFGSPAYTTGVDPVHVERLLAGKRGVTTGTDQPSSFTDNLVIQSLATVLLYAELHKIPLNDSLNAIRETPILNAVLKQNRQAMRKDYEEHYRGKNQMTIEMRHPANQPLAEKQNHQFLDRFVDALTMSARQPHTQTYPQRAVDREFRPDQPVWEMNRQTFRDAKTGDVVMRSTITLPNENRVLSKATQLLAREVNRRLGQQLIQVIQPTPQHKTMSNMLTARNGHPFSPNHRASLVPNEPIKSQIDRGSRAELTTSTTTAKPSTADRVMSPSLEAERQRPAMKVA